MNTDIIIKIINKKDDVAYWKILTFTNVTEIKKSIGKYLFKTRCKRESEVQKSLTPCDTIAE